jgi:hypothetical protein
MWKQLFLSFACGWLHVLCWCRSRSWHWPSCLWKEALQRACLIRRRGSLLGLVTPQKAMVMSPVLCVHKCALVHTALDGGCFSWCLWCGSCVWAFTCMYVYVFVCVYFVRGWQPVPLTASGTSSPPMYEVGRHDNHSSYALTEPFLWTVPAKDTVTVHAKWPGWYGQCLDLEDGVLTPEAQACPLLTLMSFWATLPHSPLAHTGLCRSQCHKVRWLSTQGSALPIMVPGELKEPESKMAGGKWVERWKALQFYHLV